MFQLKIQPHSAAGMAVDSMFIHGFKILSMSYDGFADSLLFSTLNVHGHYNRSQIWQYNLNLTSF